MTDIEESLKCLGADTIDLYFLHRDDESVSVCEILDILETARKRIYSVLWLFQLEAETPERGTEGSGG